MITSGQTMHALSPYNSWTRYRRARRSGRVGLRTHLLECGQAFLRGFHGWIPAALLLDQVVLHSALALRRVKDLLPGNVAFAEQDAIAAVTTRAPVLHVQRIDAAGIGVDPRHRVLPHFHAG